MKKAVIALAITACSAPALAAPVPPFALRCASKKAPAIPISAKWDGGSLSIAVEGSKPDIWDSPASAMFTSRPPLETARMSFHTREGRNQTYVSISLSKDGNGMFGGGFYSFAHVVDKELVSAKEIYIADCISTLDR